MEFVCAGVFIRDNGSPHAKGWAMQGHTHNFPHATYIVRGRYRARRWRRILNEDGSPKLGADGKEDWLCVADVERSAPCWFPVEPKDMHAFECLEDGGVLHCVYVPRDPVTKRPSEWNGWMEAVV